MLKGFRLIAMVVLFTGTLVADTVRTSVFFADMSTVNEVPPPAGVTASAKALIGLHLRYDSAGNIVSGVVDFESFTNRTPRTVATGSRRCSSPRNSRMTW